MTARQSLPIDAFLPQICAEVRDTGALVLVAEPGAGKTTRVPGALLDAGLARDGEIVVLEPRRLAARLAAQRVAEELGEEVGRRVGYSVRFDERSSRETRVRFVTEGILTRRLAEDPTLRGVACVVLDELHERHLHGDVALALLARARRSGGAIRLVAMSATLDAEPIARFLGCNVVRVPGRTFPVDVEYLERPDDRPLDAQVVAAVRRLVARGLGSKPELDGDVLVFLPGAGEIRRAMQACAELAAHAGLDLCALHGDLPPAEQDRAVRRGSRPKLVLSTNVAESSVTLEAVVAVIDSGLARVAGHSPWSGMPTLETRPISRASATQRAGRAGRVRAGVCLRLYTRIDHDQRPAHDVPEIRRADLTETALALHAMGEQDLGAFPWLDAPTTASLDAADALLTDLGALDAARAITQLGRRMQSLPAHPRAARLALDAASRGVPERGALLAAILGERELRESARTQLHGARAAATETGPSDLLARLDAFEAVDALGVSPSRARAHGLDPAATTAVARARDQLLRALRREPGTALSHEDEELALLQATLTAFPDRVAKRRAAGSSDVVFARGGSARLVETSVVHDAEWLVVCDADTQRGQVLARAASRIEPDWLLDVCPERIEDVREVRFDTSQERVVVLTGMRLGALLLDSSRRTDVTGPDVSQCLADAALARGIEHFVDAAQLASLRLRTAFAAQHDPRIVPLDEAQLRAELARSCEGLRTFAELRDAHLLDALLAAYTPVRERLAKLAPTHVTLGGGLRVEVHYEPERPPWISARLQNFFGMQDTPQIAEGRVKLVIHLLAPNHHAVQVTTDLAGFWDRHYPSVRKELMRQYPRHLWPEDPRAAAPPTPGRIR